MDREAFLKQRGLGATEPCRTKHAAEEERRGRRAAHRIKSNGEEDEETDEIELRARPHHETCRIAIHDALRYRDQQIDTDPAAESGSRRVKRLTHSAKKIKCQKSKARRAYHSRAQIAITGTKSKKPMTGTIETIIKASGPPMVDVTLRGTNPIGRATALYDSEQKDSEPGTLARMIGYRQLRPLGADG
jgi:hypothetical protein